MMVKEHSVSEIIHLPSAGCLPGIPGQHGAGVYVVDWLERTIKRLEDHLAEEEAKQAGALPKPEGVPESTFLPEAIPLLEQPAEAPIPEQPIEEAPTVVEEVPAAPEAANE
jgi:hypothetical protein